MNSILSPQFCTLELNTHRITSQAKAYGRLSLSICYMYQRKNFLHLAFNKKKKFDNGLLRQREGAPNWTSTDYDCGLSLLAAEFSCVCVCLHDRVECKFVCFRPRLPRKTLLKQTKNYSKIDRYSFNLIFEFEWTKAKDKCTLHHFVKNLVIYEYN